jgi:hypothetical protein
MNPTVELIFTVLGAAFTLLTLYGAATLSRKLFLSGLFCFSILPIIGESMAYGTDKATMHVMVAFLFLVQLVLAIPNTIVYGAENTAAIKITSKIAFAFLLINVAGAVFILCLKAAAPVQFGYFHVVLSLAVLYLIIRRLSSNGAVVLK